MQANAAHQSPNLGYIQASLHGPAEFNDTKRAPQELQGRNFSDQDFDNKELTDVVFRNCDLTGVSFHNARLRRVQFINCKLNDAHFHDTGLFDVNFATSQFTNAVISMSTLSNTRFNRCQFPGAILENCSLFSARLRGCNFIHASRPNSRLGTAPVIRDCNMISTHIEGCAFEEGAEIHKINARFCKFRDNEGFDFEQFRERSAEVAKFIWTSIAGVLVSEQVESLADPLLQLATSHLGLPHGGTAVIYLLGMLSTKVAIDAWVDHGLGTAADLLSKVSDKTAIGRRLARDYVYGFSDKRNAKALMKALHAIQNEPPAEPNSPWPDAIPLVEKNWLGRDSDPNLYFFLHRKALPKLMKHLNRESDEDCLIISEPNKALTVRFPRMIQCRPDGRFTSVHEDPHSQTRYVLTYDGRSPEITDPSNFSDCLVRSVTELKQTSQGDWVPVANHRRNLTSFLREHELPDSGKHMLQDFVRGYSFGLDYAVYENEDATFDPPEPPAPGM